MQDLASLWIGKALGEMERASLVSLARLGHPVTVYSYAPVANVPPGIATRDAAQIMPADRILVYRDKRKPSPALHSNLFRYALIEQTDAAWVDLDVIGLRPLPRSDYLMGFETDTSVNNAVLRLPKASPTLRQLRVFCPQTRGVAPHITGARRLKYWLRTLGRGYPIEQWAWGSTGPKALTLYLNAHDELRHALPRAAFYPVGVHDHEQILQPGRWRLADFDQSCCLHLWGSRIRKTLADSYGGQVPRGSLYAEIIETFR
ncbi:hypothetical protein [uncultured Paracoccus sp.]|uniref:hypothetical protein n=1 Tax=uncultured Paracoccus sp. TaxID=189685 RepID=UPI0025E7D6AF|nr:hypothetical protein [uncultured Paracoccus sp.]